MSLKTLIPSIVSKDRWRKYFGSEILRALGYCRKVLNLYDRILTDDSSPLVKKMVMGVIGRNTIGYWRDIQTLYRRFFGIACIGCEEAIKRIAMGIPLDNVVENVSVQAIDRWRLVEDLRVLAATLSSVINRTVSKDEVLQENTEVMIKRLSGNPLDAFRLIKGFYSTNISLLPLYNECTFFLYVARSIHRDLIDKFFPDLDMAMLKNYGVEFNTVSVCSDDRFSILIPSTNSVNQYIIIYIETLYRILKQSMRLGLTRFFKILDEEQVFISTMINEVKKIEKEMKRGAGNTIIDTILKNSLTRRTSSNYMYSTTNVLFHRDKDEVVIGSRNIRCENFFEGLTPYLITGLAYLGDIQDKGGELIKARLHIYHYNR